MSHIIGAFATVPSPIFHGDCPVQIIDLPESIAGNIGFKPADVVGGLLVSGGFGNFFVVPPHGLVVINLHLFVVCR